MRGICMGYKFGTHNLTYQLNSGPNLLVKSFINFRTKKSCNRLCLKVETCIVKRYNLVNLGTKPKFNLDTRRIRESC
jgi:hypothetical protein